LLPFIVFAVVGRLIIYIVQKFVADATEIELLNKWASCDLCSGVWVYSLLAYFFGFAPLEIFPYVPIASDLVTGCVTSFIMHLLVLGWKTKFEVVVI
jgi:hypothetical protein